MSGFANDVDFFPNTPAVSIICSYPSGTGRCDISFGDAGFSNVLENTWRHAFNVSVQESSPPVTALLLALGFRGLALRARAFPDAPA